MTRSTIHRSHHPASVTQMIFPSSYHLQTDNNQPYSRVVKLPEGCFVVIRLSGVEQLSGSVPRTGNKQSGLFRW